MQPILLPVDFSDVTDQAVKTATEMGLRLETEVWVLHVSQADLDDPKQGRAALDPKLDAVVERLVADGCQAHALLVFGPPAESILDQIEIKKPLFVVMGSHGHTSLHDLVMGSVTKSVLRSGKCPVLVVPTPRSVWRPDPADIEAANWNAYGFPFD